MQPLTSRLKSRIYGQVPRPLHLALGFTALFSILFVVLLALSTTTHQIETTTQQAELLFGTTIRVTRDTGLALLQALVIAAIAGLLSLAAFLSRRAYVTYWTLTWLALFVSYTLRVVDGFSPDTTSSVVQFSMSIASVLSTTFALLAGQSLACEETPPISFKESLKPLLGCAVGTALALVIGRTLVPNLNHATGALADASAGATAILLMGMALHQRLLQSALPWWFRWGPLAFLMYAALQMTAPFIAQVGWSSAVFAAALVLKIHCSLAVVGLALSETFSESASARAELEGKSQQLQDELTRGTTLRNQERSRQKVFEDLAELITDTAGFPSVLSRLLQTVALHCDCPRACLVVHAPQQSSDGYCLVIAEVTGVDLRQGSRVAILKHASDDSHPASQEVLRAVVSHVFPSVPDESSCVCLELKLPQSAPAGWIVMQGVTRKTQREVAPILQEALQRVGLGLELVLLRDQLQSLREIRELLRESPTISDQLAALVKLAATTVNAAGSTLDAQDDRSGLRYVQSHPRQLAELESNPPSPYPQLERLHWVTPTRSSHSTDIPEVYSLLSLPIRSFDNTVAGVLTCHNKHMLLAGERSPSPFTPYDLRRLEVVVEMCAIAIDRAERHRSLEILLQRSVHELRNPVNSLRNIQHWVRRHIRVQAASAELAAKYEKKMKDAAIDLENLARMVELVSVYRRPSADVKRTLRVFGELIMKQRDDIRRRLREEGVSPGKIGIKVTNARVIPPIPVVAAVVEQVISNLVDNAIKYRNRSDDSFTIEFEGDLSATHYLVRVRDWGMGVPEGWEERIFKEGERAPNAMRRDVSGMGMGLAIAKQNAERDGGHLVLTHRSNPTEFTLGFTRSNK